jgi:glycerol kinase
MQAGIYPDADGFAATWALERQFTPAIPTAEREAKYEGWRAAVGRALTR